MTVRSSDVPAAQRVDAATAALAVAGVVTTRSLLRAWGAREPVRVGSRTV